MLTADVGRVLQISGCRALSEVPQHKAMCLTSVMLQIVWQFEWRPLPIRARWPTICINPDCSLS